MKKTRSMFLSNFFKFKKLSNDKKIWLVSNESKVLKRNLQKLYKNKIQIALPSNLSSRILWIFSKQRDIILYHCILIHATILSQIKQSIYQHPNFATTHTCMFQNSCQIPETIATIIEMAYLPNLFETLRHARY